MWRAKQVVVALALGVVLYFSHRLLQMQHHRHCKSDLFRIVMFDQSPVCVHMTNVLNLVEVACHHAAKLITAQVLNTLSGVAPTPFLSTFF
jgi:hypothetical protein